MYANSFITALPLAAVGFFTPALAEAQTQPSPPETVVEEQCQEFRDQLNRTLANPAGFDRKFRLLQLRGSYAAAVDRLRKAPDLELEEKQRIAGHYLVMESDAAFRLVGDGTDTYTTKLLLLMLMGGLSSGLAFSSLIRHTFGSKMTTKETVRWFFLPLSLSLASFCGMRFLKDYQGDSPRPLLEPDVCQMTRKSSKDLY